MTTIRIWKIALWTGFLLVTIGDGLSAFELISFRTGLLFALPGMVLCVAGYAALKARGVH